MSFKNGDRSRAHRLRKAKIKLRTKTRDLRNSPATPTRPQAVKKKP